MAALKGQVKIIIIFFARQVHQVTNILVQFEILWRLVIHLLIYLFINFD